jgi:hypothetical protein
MRCHVEQRVAALERISHRVAVGDIANDFLDIEPIEVDIEGGQPAALSCRTPKASTFVDSYASIPRLGQVISPSGISHEAMKDRQ